MFTSKLKHSIYTFNAFWAKYHNLNPQYKLKKELCKRLWERTISLELKKKAFNNIRKGLRIDAYEFLKRELNYNYLNS